MYFHKIEVLHWLPLFPVLKIKSSLWVFIGNPSGKTTKNSIFLMYLILS